MMKSMITKPPFLMRSVGRASSFCSSAVQWEGGVSMVQGASRGIGLEFVKQLLGTDAKSHVVATCRNPDGATGLLELKRRFADRLNILPLDVTNEGTIEAAAASIKSSYGSLNLLINAAGILSIPDVLQPVTKTISVEFARRKDAIICILLHPGTVDTDLSRPFQRNVAQGKLFTTEFSVQKLLGIIDGCKASDNGRYFAWDGQQIPW